MNKILDLGILKKMPITDEFCKMLFGESSSPLCVEVELKGSNRLFYKYTNIDNCMFCIVDNGVVWCKVGNVDYPFNAFQIVRYIDNYLSERKKNISDLVLYLATNSEPTKKNLINGIESVPFAYIVSEDKFVPINKKDMDRKVTDFEFLTRGEVLPT